MDQFKYLYSHAYWGGKSLTLRHSVQDRWWNQFGLDPQVRVLKEKIEAEKGKEAFPVSGQKLIYAGKILSDDVPIKEYKIDEKNFVVVMVTKVWLGTSIASWECFPGNRRLILLQ